MTTTFNKHTAAGTAEVTAEVTETGAILLELTLNGVTLDELTVTPIMAAALKRHFAIEMGVIKPTAAELAANS